MQSLAEIHDFVYKKYVNSNHFERFTHILGVVEMASSLAKRYGCDENKAIIAAYMHDYCKYESNEELAKIIRQEDALECAKYPVLYHSYASAEVYLQQVGNDLDIYNAIRNHVFGRLNMSKLEEIILISDYTEKNRTYKSCIECRELLEANKFYLAIYESTRHTIEFLKNKGIEPHPLQLEVLEYYRGLKEWN